MQNRISLPSCWSTGRCLLLVGWYPDWRRNHFLRFKRTWFMLLGYHQWGFRVYSCVIICVYVYVWYNTYASRRLRLHERRSLNEGRFRAPVPWKRCWWMLVRSINVLHSRRCFPVFGLNGRPFDPSEHIIYIYTVYMYMYICKCIYVYMYICIYVYIVCMYVCMYVMYVCNVCM